MKPIEQLIEEVNGSGEQDAIEYHKAGGSLNLKVDLYVTNAQGFEALRQAIIKDFVNGLEPVAYNHHFVQDDDFMPEEVLSHSESVPAIIGCKYANKTVGLYDLRQWRTK